MEKVWNARPNPSLCVTPSGPSVTVCALPDEAMAKTAVPVRTAARIQRCPDCFKALTPQWRRDHTRTGAAGQRRQFALSFRGSQSRQIGFPTCAILGSSRLGEFARASMTFVPFPSAVLSASKISRDLPWTEGLYCVSSITDVV